MLYLLAGLVGFIPLVFGANWLVDGASGLARRMRIPPIVIGLTIVAFGTSAPELVVNLVAALSGNPGIVMGNVIGSNIFNVLLILGVSALIIPLEVQKNTTWIEVPLALLAATAVFLTANDVGIDGSGANVISRVDGIMLLLFFLIFLGYNLTLAKDGIAQAGPENDLNEDGSQMRRSTGLLLFMVIGGIVLLVAGGRVIVLGSVEFARLIGIPDRIIGLTIVAAGTSLPELATSVSAAIKKNLDIAIGNVVGSNIFNIFFILGLSATIRPVPLSPGMNLDLIVNMAASLLLFIFIFTGRGKRIERAEGLLFLLMYGVYLAWLLISL